MQMYLWSGKGINEVVVGSTIFQAQGAEFGPTPTVGGISATIKLVNDGTSPTSDACQALPAGSMSGAIALIDRGTCDFTVKVKNAQNAGALAAIVANNRDGDTIITMGGDDASITIPAVFISQNSGTTLKAMVPASGTVRLTDPPPLLRDGDLDSDIVFHEYCHGLTWRMIGRMNGALAGAVGEGMSDVCAMLMNGDPVIGEYAFDDAHGIRRFSYAGYPNTYSDVTGAEVHDDGEIYAAIGWRLIELFGAARRDDLFGYLVDGMNYTPEAPTYEQMRDGILQSIAINPAQGGDDCLVWSAFAQFGVGVGAQGTARGPSAKIIESFAPPAACVP
jgi:extracellular elastinolytic metalloproteinase